MPWIRLDDQIAHHKKFLAAGPMASWLWVCGQSYSARYLTDGFVPSAALHSLGSVLNPKRYADKLVEVGLWECAEGGYRVHDYHDYQPTAEEVRHTREVRREAGREGGKRSGERRTGRNTSEANGKQNASGLLGACFDNVEAKPNPVPVPVPGTPEERKNGGAVAPRFPRAVQNSGPEGDEPEPRAPSSEPPPRRRTRDVPKVRTIAALIRLEGIQLEPEAGHDEADIAADVKTACAERGLPYDSRSANSAIESERVKRRRGLARASPLAPPDDDHDGGVH